jgi:hypothetical protein
MTLIVNVAFVIILLEDEESKYDGFVIVIKINRLSLFR